MDAFQNADLLATATLDTDLVISIDSTTVPTRLNNLDLSGGTTGSSHQSSNNNTTATTNSRFAATARMRLTNNNKGTNKRQSLPAGYVPGPKDVVCGRGKRNWNHAGNVHFRNLIRTHVQTYMDAPTKNDKTLIVISIVDEIRRDGGRFLKEDLYGRFYDIGDAQARDKVGHSLRDQVTSTNKANKPKRLMGGIRAGGTHKAMSHAARMASTEDELASNHSAEYNTTLAATTFDQDPLINIDAPRVRTKRVPLYGRGSGGTSSTRHHHKKTRRAEESMVRRPSIRASLSDSGAETEQRRSSGQASSGNFGSILLSAFNRRPSLLAFSFDSRDGKNVRASNLLQMDNAELARETMQTARRSSNWDFLDSLDEIMEEYNPNNNYGQDGNNVDGDGEEEGDDDDMMMLDDDPEAVALSDSVNPFQSIYFDDEDMAKLDEVTHSLTLGRQARV